MILSKKELDKILFLDIETVPIVESYKSLDEEGKTLWDIKSSQINKFQLVGNSSEPEDLYHQKAGIYSEFSKVACISIGYLKLGKEIRLRLKSFCDEDEINVLLAFAELLDKYFDNPKRDYLCGHNLKEFDIPFLCRRMVVNGSKFPKLLKISGKKPWQVEHLIDTLQLWKFGDFKNYTSLRLLTYALGIPSPKEDMDGSMVAKVFYEEKDYKKLIRYCENDVAAVARVMLKMHHFNPHDMLIEHVD